MVVGPQGPVGAPLRPHHSITTATFTTTSGQSHGKDRIQHHLDILLQRRHAHNTWGSAHKSHQLCITGNLATKTRGSWRAAAYVSRSFLVLASSWACCGRMLAVPRMVAISPCMKAHGTDDPARGHRSPLGQYTSVPAPCRLMDSLEQGKQNLWWRTEGHCTKWVSSSRSVQMVHLRLLLGCGPSPPLEPPLCAPGLLSPLESPCRPVDGLLRGSPELGDSWDEFLETERCWGEAELWGEPGGRLSVTLWRAAMGDGPLVEELGPSGEEDTAGPCEDPCWLWLLAAACACCCAAAAATTAAALTGRPG